MPWTAKQQEFREMALAPVARGMAIHIALCQDGAGVTQIVDKLSRHDPRGAEARAVSVFTGDSNNAVWELANQASVTGRNYSDVIRKSLLKLSDQNTRPVTIIFQEAQLLRVCDMEKLLLALEDVILKERLSVRVILHQRQIERWNQPKNGAGYYQPGWPQIPNYLESRKRSKRLQFFAFNSEGLEQLQGREIPREVFEDVICPREERKSA